MRKPPFGLDADPEWGFSFKRACYKLGISLGKVTQLYCSSIQY